VVDDDVSAAAGISFSTNRSDAGRVAAGGFRVIARPMQINDRDPIGSHARKQVGR